MASPFSSPDGGGGPEVPPASCSSSSSSSSSSLLERAFECIQSGNDLESASQPWLASERFAASSAILRRLADHEVEAAAAAAARANQADSNRHDEESSLLSDDKKKIAALYAQQSREYLVRSRSVFLRALQEEHEEDEMRSAAVMLTTSASTTESSAFTSHETSHPPPVTPSVRTAAASVANTTWRKSLTIPDDELDQRTRLFAILFARPLSDQALDPRRSSSLSSTVNNSSHGAPDPSHGGGSSGAGGINVAEDTSVPAPTATKEQLIEERWRLLNENLPKSLQTEEQRMARINRGLNRLGLASVVQNIRTPFSASMSPPGTATITSLKSESEQVEDIIAQVSDEVRMMSTMHPTSDHHNIDSSPKRTHSTCMDDGDGADVDNSMSSADIMADTDDEDGGAGEDYYELTPVQVASLREHVASAQAELAQLAALLQPDADGDAEIEFDPSSGSRHLLRARASLKRAASEWRTASTTDPKGQTQEQGVKA
jgi:hypothetical protein